jgi:amino acid permease
MEVYIMSNHQWNEKQIKKAHESRKHKKGWLNARDIRSGIPVVAVRQLMTTMVDRGLAFDNKISPDSEEYKICFNIIRLTTIFFWQLSVHIIIPIYSM